MPVAVDFIFAFILVVAASIFEYLYFWPRFRAAVAAGRPGARRGGYQRAMAGQWLFAVTALAIWVSQSRPWGALRLTLPHGWRLVLGVAFVVAAVGLLVLQLWSVARLSAERRIAARPKLGQLAFLLPHTAQEERWFIALAVTAGCCEEILSRGYLPWFFAPWLGPAVAMILVVAMFGISHAYQGRKGAIKATLAGTVMATIVLASGSLIPAMIVHALVDIGGGTVGYWLLREQVVTSSVERESPRWASLFRSYPSSST